MTEKWEMAHHFNNSNQSAFNILQRLSARRLRALPLCVSNAPRRSKQQEQTSSQTARMPA
jgi:hypothetical protein